MSDDIYKEPGVEIIAMGEVDQAMRKGGVWDKTVDLQHTARMQEIIAQIGWPTISKVGEQASHMAWLLVQHASHERAFQRSCLELMKAQPASEVSPQNIAYLEDRVRVGEGRPQLYGTQFRATDQGELEPFPIEDQEQVDTRRARVGLETFAAYTAQLKTAYDKLAR